MKTLIISYSFTGNNNILAESISAGLPAEHFRITEPKPRSFFSIALDMLFNRTPRVDPLPEKMDDYDLLVFVGPVWMGHIASPFRACFKKYKHTLKRYAYVSLSGGADGPNTKLTEDLIKRTSKEPVAVINLLITDILRGQGDVQPSRKETESYRLSPEEAKKFTPKILGLLQAV